MLTNLLRPWFLAHLVTAGVAAALLAYGAFVAITVLRHFHVGQTSEGQLALERRAELVSALVQAALVAELFAVALGVLGADRTSGQIRGAMCAYGVLGSSDYGFASLAIGLAASLGCALWLVLHRLDLRLPTPALTRRKFGALLLVAPLVFAELGVSTAFVLDLDLGVVASCCSASLDRGVEAVAAAGPAWSRSGTALVATLACGLAIATSFAAGARPTRVSQSLAALASVLAAIAVLPAVLWYVAPHAYESPHHLCPFCLLRAEGLYLGYPLGAALFAALAFGAGLGVVESQRGLAAGASSELGRVLSRRAAVAWAFVLVVCAAPVVRFAVLTGGASLFS